MAVPADVLAQWAKYQDIAIQFHTLLIQTRLQAIGGLAALAAAALVASERASDEQTRRRALLRVIQVMLIIWFGVAVLDIAYYSELLRGAVTGLVAFESTHKELQLTTTISQTVGYGACAPCVFHAAVLLCLGLAMVYLWQQARRGEKASAAKM